MLPEFEVRVETLAQTRQPTAKIYLPKIQMGKGAIAPKQEGLIYHRDPQKSWTTLIEPELKRVEAHNASVRQREPTKIIDVVVFPELSVPRGAVDELTKWSAENRIIVIAGTHYEKFGDQWRSVCPVIIDGIVFETYKIVPSPFENPGISDEGLHPGPFIRKFRNSRIGNFCVLICSDYLDDRVRHEIIDSEVDIIFVIACQKDVQKHYALASIDVQHSLRGLYVCYSNLTFPQFGSGKSAVFGLVHRDFEGHFKRLGYTDLDPREKLWQSNSRYPSAIASLDLQEKKPGLPKTTRSQSNVIIYMMTDFLLRPVGLVKSAFDVRAYKVVAFDFDGTLLRGPQFQYSWAAIWETLWGDTDKLKWKGLMRDYLLKKITYKEWCEIAISEFRQKGIRLDQIIGLAKEFKLIDNCLEVLMRLKAEGYKLIIVSGGVDVFLKAHLTDIKSIFDQVHINELGFDMDHVVLSVKATTYDYEHKRTAVQEFCEIEGIAMEDVVYVGDSINDEALLGGEVGCFISLAKDDDERVSIGANYHLLRNDLEAVYEIVVRGKEQPNFGSS
jgi:HAD superfamily phosphoserine phosphatase-like hydrolase